MPLPPSITLQPFEISSSRTGQDESGPDPDLPFTQAAVQMARINCLAQPFHAFYKHVFNVDPEFALPEIIINGTRKAEKDGEKKNAFRVMAVEEGEMDIDMDEEKGGGKMTKKKKVVGFVGWSVVEASSSVEEEGEEKGKKNEKIPSTTADPLVLAKVEGGLGGENGDHENKTTTEEKKQKETAAADGPLDADTDTVPPAPIAQNPLDPKPHLKELYHQSSDRRDEEMDECYQNASKGLKHIIIKSLFVDPSYQRRSIGSALFQHVLAIADNASPPLPVFLTSSEMGHDLYVRHGFVDLAKWETDIAYWARRLAETELELGMPWKEDLVQQTNGMVDRETVMVRWAKGREKT